MDYLLKASAVVVIFYVCYKLFLQRETFFTSNRWFLLAGLVIATLIPSIVIPIYIEYTPTSLEGFVMPDATQVQNSDKPFDWLLLLFWFYASGATFFLGRLLVEFSSLFILFKKHQKFKDESFICVETNQNIAPFSFFNWIVYNPNQFTDDELELIIKHEKVHAKQFHSIDMIVSHIATVVFWFNPLMWLYKKELQQNLEFIADRKAQNQSDCEKSYQKLLLKTSIPNHQLVLTNNFYNSLIKKRIVMLHTSKSKKLNAWKYAFIIPALAIFMMSFNTKEVLVEKSSTDNEFIITPETTNNDLKVIENQFEDKTLKLKFADIKRNTNGELQRVSITTKSPKDKRYIKRMSLNENLKQDKIVSFKVNYNAITNAIGYTNLNTPYSTSNINGNNITFSENNSVSAFTTKNKSLVITKDFTDADFENLKKELKSRGFDSKFKGIKRNDKGEITSIKIEITSDKTESQYNIDDDQPISPIQITIDDETKSISIGNGKIKSAKGYSFTTEDGTHKIKSSGEGSNVFVFSSDEDDSESKEEKIIIKKRILSEDDKSNKSKKMIFKSEDGKETVIELDDDSKENVFFIKNEKDGKLSKDTIWVKKNANKVIWTDDEGEVIDINAEESGNKRVRIITEKSESPLILLNGKEITKKAMNELNTDDIKKVNVLKGTSATEKYGDKAKDGVIEITTKKKN